MKRILVFLIAMVAIVMSTCVPAHAQGYTTKNAVVEWADRDNGKAVMFHGVIDSVNSYTSKSFTLAGFQGESFATYPVRYRYRNVSAAGKPFVTHIIQGTLGDTTWFNIDTLCVKDSSETLVRGTIDFNGEKCYAYRLVSSGGTSGDGGKNRSDTVSEVTFFVARKD
ncbi:MAG: hypothetical protein AB1728_13285 [Bacteroidota bacterium]